MRPLLESVPNFSEGRDPAVLEELASVLGAGTKLLDVHSDADHHRSVFTLVGEEEPLLDALVAGVRRASELIDLRLHAGVHPRVGVADVVPVVPLVPEDMPRARSAALELARRIGDEVGLPVFLYGELAPGRGPAFYRRGGLEALRRRVTAGELVPSFGPSEVGGRAGAVLVGARAPLVAFNVNLRGTLEAAREVARVIRERDGGLPGVRALGLELPGAGVVQVSMNVEDPEATPLHELVARIEREAAARGAEVLGSELVGLVPAHVVAAAAGAALRLEGLDVSRVLELRLADES